MSGMLILLLVQCLFQFGAKKRNERAIMERKIILTCPFPLISEKTANKDHNTENTG